MTALGKLVASVIALVGIAAVAMPSGILAASFMRVLPEKADPSS